jgi:hypothetical protein
MVVAERHPAVEPRGGPARWPDGRGFWLAVIALAVLAAGAVVALGLLAAGGPEPRARWGYTAATLAFLLSAAQAAPILALVSRLGRGHWGIPLRRAAELFAVAGLVTAPLTVLLLVQLPPTGERPSIWFGWPGAPLLWDSVAVALLALVGLALLYVASVPDRTRAGRAQRLGSVRWLGSVRQWKVLSLGVVLLGALYAILFVFVQVLVASDLALGLVPGWDSAILPAQLAISGFQAGLAATVLVAAGLHRSAAWHESVDVAAFQAAGKLLLALALFWFYFWWSELLTYWYGRLPEERWLLELLMFGPYFGLFLASMLLNFLLPTVLLIWNGVRDSVAGPTLVAALVLVGTLVDRVRIFVAAWSEMPPSLEHPMSAPLPPTHWPGPIDLVIVIGALAAVGLLYLLALRLVPAVSLWELRWGERLAVERHFLDIEVDVVARPS